MNGLVSCKNCTTQNSLDSAFCKKCGATLPDDDVRQAKVKLEAAVADGFRIFNAGRTDEAAQIADVAIRANPTSTAALSLRAMCHERVGQIAEALECHERVLEIDPDSMIDKIKVNDLKNLLVARSSIASAPDRRMAVMGAAATFVLVASIGLVIAKSGSRSTERVASNNPANTNVQAQGARFEPPAAAPNQQSNLGAQAAPGGTQPNGNPNPSEAPKQPQANSDRNSGSDRVPPLPDENSKQIPTFAGNGYAPLRVNPDQPVQNNQSKNPGSNPTSPPIFQTGPPIDPPPTDDSAGQTNPPAKQEAPGIMEIKVVSRNGKPTAEAGDTSTHPNGVQALLRAAQIQYQTNNYQSAATSYERALRAGADPAMGNQRLAQCYEKLGRNSEALAAYNRAVDALQLQLSSGKGDKNRLGAALETCRQAAKVLGG